jgi:hypothetical protein
MSIPTLTDVKAALNITGSDQDQLLELFRSSALKLIEMRVGPSSVQTFVETVSSHANALLLSNRPVASITSVVPKINTWPTFTASDVSYDIRSGVLWRNDLGTLAGVYDITYTAGWGTFPDNYHLATLVTVQHLWRTQRGGSKRPNMGGTDDLNVHIGSGLTRTLLGGSITLPAAALELIADSIYFGGIA